MTDVVIKCLIGGVSQKSHPQVKLIYLTAVEMCSLAKLAIRHKFSCGRLSEVSEERGFHIIIGFLSIFICSIITPISFHLADL